jgi:hypothetical protein
MHDAVVAMGGERIAAQNGVQQRGVVVSHAPNCMAGLGHLKARFALPIPPPRGGGIGAAT